MVLSKAESGEQQTAGVEKPVGGIVQPNASLSDHDVVAIAEEMHDSLGKRTIATIDLSNNNIHGEGAAALAQAIGETGGGELVTLNLSHNRIGALGMCALAGVLGTGSLPTGRAPEKAIRMRLEVYAYGRLSIVKSIQADGKNCVVEHFGGTIVYAKTSALLGVHHQPGKWNMRSLHCLNLGTCHIGVAGASAVAAALAANSMPSLKVLDLSHNELVGKVKDKEGFWIGTYDRQGIDSVSNALRLKFNLEITEINLAANAIADEEISEMCRHLNDACCPALEVLNLARNQIRNIQGTGLEGAICGKCPAMNTLNLQGNSVSYETIEDLNAVFKCAHFKDSNVIC